MASFSRSTKLLNDFFYICLQEYVKAYNMKSVTLRQRYNRLVALKVSGLGERRLSFVCGDVVNVYGEYSLHQVCE